MMKIKAFGCGPSAGLRLEFRTIMIWLVMVMPQAVGADPLYWGGTSGQSWTSATWSSTGDSPYSSPWVSGSHVVFSTPGSLITGATTQIAGITANESVTVTPSGTLGTGGTIATIEVAAGKTLGFGNQAFSSAIGTGFVKNGAGTLVLAGGTFSGGFTLNAGTVGIGGVNALGAGGALHINGGTLQSSSVTTARDLSGKFAGGIHLGGNFAFAGGGSLRFDDVIDLGAGTRTITNSSAGSVTLAGNITGAGGTGLVFGGNGSTVLSGANTYDGPTLVNSGIVTFGKPASIPASGLAIVANNATVGFTMGAGAFSDSDISAAFAGNVPNLSLSPNSRIGIDVPSGNHIFNGTTQGTMGLVKLGSGTLFLDGSSLGHRGGIHVPVVSGVVSVVDFSGESFASTGGWHIGQATGAGGIGSATVNFQSSSRVGIDPTESINVGFSSGFSAGLQTLNAGGEVLNYGSLRIRGRGVVNVNSSGTWLQEGEMSVQAVGSGEATLSINANGALKYVGTTPIQLAGSSAGTGRALVTINGGLLETRQGFVGPPGPGTLGYSRLTLGNSGTLRILDDVTNLTSQVQVVLDNGGGIIETWGDTTLSGIVTGSPSPTAGITGIGGITKTGPGSLTLTGTNTYSGLTQVEGGTLLVDGSITRSTVIVQSGATLGGSGGLIGNGGDELWVDDGGTLAPGASAGVLTIDGSATIAGTYAYEFDGAGGGANTDLLQVGGTLHLFDAELSLTNLGTYAVGDKFTLITYLTFFGEFTGYTDDEEFTFGGGSWRIDYDDPFPGLNGGTGPLFVTLTAVPEVSITWLCLAGAVGMVRRRTR